MEIRDLGKDTFLVGRRVIKAGKPGMFDLSKQDDRDELVRIVETRFKSKFDLANYGPMTVCVLYPKNPVYTWSQAKYEQGQMHFGDLHDEAKEILRKEFPEYADNI